MPLLCVVEKILGSGVIADVAVYSNRYRYKHINMNVSDTSKCVKFNQNIS